MLKYAVLIICNHLSLFLNVDIKCKVTIENKSFSNHYNVQANLNPYKLLSSKLLSLIRNFSSNLTQIPVKHDQI